jgi:hypothetical protein
MTTIVCNRNSTAYMVEARSGTPRFYLINWAFVAQLQASVMRAQPQIT